MMCDDSQPLFDIGKKSIEAIWMNKRCADSSRRGGWQYDQSSQIRGCI